MSSRYPQDWETRRRKVYRRDDFICQNCGAQGGTIGNAELHAHHIVPVDKGGTHQLSNLKTMCSNCHSAIHGGPNAPTANDEPNPTGQGFLAGIKNTMVDASFHKCPFCDSTRIGQVGQESKFVECSNCHVRFEINEEGWEIVDLDDKLAKADLPIIYDRELMGHSLTPTIWQEVGNAEDISQLDFDSLEEQTKVQQSKVVKSVPALILVAIFIYIITYAVTNSIQLTMILGGALAVIVVLSLWGQINQSSIDIDSSR